MSSSLQVPIDPNDIQLVKCLPIPYGDRKNVYELQAIRMALIHNVLIRGYNTILYYSQEVQPGTKKCDSFIRYCDLLNHNVHHHHAIEEENYFPWLEARLGAHSMDANVDGHHAFHAPFEVFENLVASIRDKKASYEATEFRKAVYAFLPPLLDHLAAEIETLRADRVRHIPQVEVEKMEKDTEEVVKKTESLVVTPPVWVMNGDAKNGAWFPPIPAPILWIAMNTLYWLNSDLWVFCAADKNRRVKPQFQAYEPELEQAPAAVAAPA